MQKSNIMADGNILVYLALGLMKLAIEPLKFRHTKADGGGIHIQTYTHKPTFIFSK
jgi:hypothetical protein